MIDTDRINRWNTRFASEITEAEFQSFIFPGNLRNNVLAMAIALPFFGLYAILDYLVLTDPISTVLVRLSIVGGCLLVLLGFTVQIVRRQHETISGLMVFALALVVVFTIWSEPGLNNSYYVGLIQGAVFISFLLRISFLKSISILTLMLASFLIIAQTKTDAEQAVVQGFILATNFTTCAFGIYLLQIYRRMDFLKSKVIARQNEQLTEMLADARLDNERKLAALNTLIHFVKTPIHQIVGFTDLIVAALKEMQTPGAAAQIEHADFVKKASAELSANVARLLAYYQLDEQIKGAQPEEVPLASMLDDFKECLSSEMTCVIDERPRAIFNYMAPIKAAMSCLESACMTSMSGASTMNITATSRPDGVDLAFVDDGPEMTPERFNDLSKPLTKIKNYLTSDGMAMPMALRTVARAAEICGGKLAFHRAEDRNVLTISLADLGEPDAAVRDKRSDAA